MNYAALIENRKSVRAFRDNPVSDAAVQELRYYYRIGCQRLNPEIRTELEILGTEAREKLEGCAGYEDFLIGAPQYLVLRSEHHENSVENAAYMMEDLILKLEEMNLSSCWITFTDPEKLRTALDLPGDLEIAAVAAFGYGQKLQKKMRFNILSMSRVDMKAKQQYYAHKKDIGELVWVDEPGVTQDLNERVGFYDDMLWQALYAASQSPSYLNRQPYAFYLKDQEIYLVNLPDEYTDPVSARQNLGVVMLHFSAIARQWTGTVRWELNPAQAPALPQGCTAAAVCRL